MDYVIHIEGFHDLENKFLPKEVAVASLQNCILDHWIVKEPYNFAHLPNDIKETNNYSSANVNGLTWYEGDVSLEHVDKNLQFLAKLSNRIFVYDHEIANYVENVMGRRTVHLTKFGVPPATVLRNKFPRSPKCLLHAEDKFVINEDHCALFKAHNIKKWLQSLLPSEWLKYKNNLNSQFYYSSLLCYDRAERDKRSIFETRLQPPYYDEVDAKSEYLPPTTNTSIENEAVGVKLQKDELIEKVTDERDTNSESENESRAV